MPEVVTKKRVELVLRAGSGVVGAVPGSQLGGRPGRLRESSPGQAGLRGGFIVDLARNEPRPPAVSSIHGQHKREVAFTLVAACGRKRLQLCCFELVRRGLSLGSGAYRARRGG